MWDVTTSGIDILNVRPHNLTVTFVLISIKKQDVWCQDLQVFDLSLNYNESVTFLL